MSIQTELTRINNNIKNAFAACRNAGVSVAANATSNDLTTAINAVANMDIDCGTFTDTTSGAAIDGGTF